MSSGSQFKDEMLQYLRQEEQYTEADILRRKALPDEEKVAAGLLIRDACLREIEKCGSLRDPDKWLLSVPENFTKLRPGDVVKLKPEYGRAFDAKVLENRMDSLLLSVNYGGQIGDLYRVQVEEKCFIRPFIECMERIRPGDAGMDFLDLISGASEPKKNHVRKDVANGSLTRERIALLNEQQRKASEIAFNFPSLHCIQGPPGTGKTDVLATIALGLSEAGCTVVVLAGTHQAVNNALAKISDRSPETCTVKIGDPLRAEELDSEKIHKLSFNAYRSQFVLSGSDCTNGDVIGMTIHSAVYHLPPRDSSPLQAVMMDPFNHNPLGYRPFVVLVDEAGQMPLGQVAIIGSFGARSVILIGDDKQMPPIFHEKLMDDPLSVSAFRYITKMHPNHRTRLSVTYRLNEPIARLVSRAFYEDDGEALVASDISRDRRLMLLPPARASEAVFSLLASDEALMSVNPSTLNTWEDFNVEEASFIAELVQAAVQGGMSYENIAVITPYRRQVRTVREKVLALNPDAGSMLMDTVERLQGQDVDLIILSFSVSSPGYFLTAREFILNPNRLNVMLSRAKLKVIIVASNLVRSALKDRYGITPTSPE
ncbi:MAG: DEAD/DEAH box helicase [Akkermansia sp.]